MSKKEILDKLIEIESQLDDAMNTLPENTDMPGFEGTMGALQSL